MKVSDKTKARHEASRREWDAKTLKAIHGYYSEYAIIPSYQTITERMGAYAKSWAHSCVARLILSGHLVRTPEGRLAPGDNFFEGL